MVSIPLHAIVLLASACGLCPARGLYTSCTLTFARTRKGVCEVGRKIMRRFLRNTKIEWKLELALRSAPRLAEYKVYFDH